MPGSSGIIGLNMSRFRTNTCGELTDSFAGKTVTISGWVHSRRDHGGLIFVDLRDRYGLTQVKTDPVNFKEAHASLDKVRPEFVVRVTGKVAKRPSGMENPKLHTGKIEVLASEVEILNESKTPPFPLDEETHNEELRLKYRYLDLRRERLKNNVVTRHKIIKFIRDFLDKQKFLEIETPILIKGTPEGSREYIIPSRLHPGKFYVLPQSPQQLKQLAMVSGLDRYFQIARCFRDEDTRGDRQPEFTQLDLEMSFVEEEDVLQVNEALMLALCDSLAPKKKILQRPFPRMSWEEAMTNYGSDKPDLRFGMVLADVTDLVMHSKFNVFNEVIKKKGVAKALKAPNGAKFSRKDIDNFTETAKIHGAKGLAYITLENGEIKSPIAKYFTKEELEKIVLRTEMQEGDLVFFAADEFRVACLSLGAVRLALADKFNLRNPNIFAFCWVIDFPMFEWSDEENKIVAAHHPFCSIREEDIPLLEDNPLKAHAKAYDFVLNGVEVAGGSIRIHKPELQSKIFKVLGITKEEAAQRFGHMLEAFTYGAPPHGGIAWGLDRLIMIFCDEPNIREVIVFPKDQRARDLMLDAPSELPENQIREMNIKVIEGKK